MYLAAIASVKGDSTSTSTSTSTSAASGGSSDSGGSSSYGVSSYSGGSTDSSVSSSSSSSSSTSTTTTVTKTPAGVYGSKYATADALAAAAAAARESAHTAITTNQIKGAMKQNYGSISAWAKNNAAAEGIAGSGIYGTKFSSESDLLAWKANEVNKSWHWTASSFLDVLSWDNLTLEKWYKNHGKAEGYATGGITPINQPFWVGENGPELMMSPHSYGVLNNRDSVELAKSSFYGSSYGSSDSSNAQLEEIYQVLRAILRRDDAATYRLERLERLVDKWDKDGLPQQTAA